MGDRIIKKTNRYLLAIFIDHKNIVRPIKPFVNTETDCNHTYYDYMKPMQKNFHPNFHISHVGTEDLPTDMTLEEISEKNISFSKHLKLENNEVVGLGIVQGGDSYKVKAEALKKLLCTKYNMHFIFRSNINVK